MWEVSCSYSFCDGRCNLCEGTHMCGNRGMSHEIRLEPLHDQNYMFGMQGSKGNVHKLTSSMFVLAFLSLFWHPKHRNLDDR